MTRIEAEEMAKELNSKEPDIFCPLIPGPCNKKCPNFTNAYVFNKNTERKGLLHNIKDDSFDVDGRYCSNYMFLGPFFDLPCMCDEEE